MPTPEIQEKALYKDQDLAELFDLPIYSIRELFKKGHIKGRKIGKRWVISGKSLLSLFDEAEETPKNDQQENEIIEERL